MPYIFLFYPIIKKATTKLMRAPTGFKMISEKLSEDGKNKNTS